MFEGAIRLLTAILFTPEKAWEELATMKNDNAFFKKNYLYPTFILMALFSLIGGYLVSDEYHFRESVREMVVLLVVVCGSFIISSYGLNELLGVFSPKDKDITVSRHFVAYSSSAIYILHMLVALFNDLFFLWMFALYTAYIVYVGSFKFIRLIEAKRIQFVVAASLLILLVPYFIRIIMSHVVIKA